MMKARHEYSARHGQESYDAERYARATSKALSRPGFQRDTLRWPNDNPMWTLEDGEHGASQTTGLQHVPYLHGDIREGIWLGYVAAGVTSVE